MEPADTAWMVIGEVAGPFGVKGEIKVTPLTDYPERFKRLERIYLGPERREHTVEGSRIHHGRILLKLANIDSPEQVAGMRNVELAVPRAEAQPLPPGAYYLDDLIGVQVRTSEHQSLGTITEVLRTGSNDVWVVSNGRETVLVPAISDAVSELNTAARYAVIEPWVLQTEE